MAISGRVTLGGYAYPYVKIGDQYWFAENLNWKWTGLTFRDGSSGNTLVFSGELPEAAYYRYDSLYSSNKYGLLYNWYAVDYLNNNLAALGVPDGWHVPSKDEYATLISTIGSDPGPKLRATTDWSSGTATDDYGFCALPGGNFDTNGGFYNISSRAHFWAADQSSSSNAWFTYLTTDSNVYTSNYTKYAGISLRLVYTKSGPGPGPQPVTGSVLTRIKFGSSFVLFGGSMTTYSGPIVPQDHTV